jgi:hypothetical protein
MFAARGGGDAAQPSTRVTHVCALVFCVHDQLSVSPYSAFLHTVFLIIFASGNSTLLSYILYCKRNGD